MVRIEGWGWRARGFVDAAIIRAAGGAAIQLHPISGIEMGIKPIVWMALIGVGAAFSTPSPAAQAPQHSMPGMTAPAADSRLLVKFPETMRLHTIASMRDHLLALQEIDVALSQNAFDKAASIAETRLGMSSLEMHGAAHIAPYMPQGMQEIGSRMHRAASRFAVDAQSASVSNDPRPALAALGTVMQQCVACHASYRLH